MQENPEIKEVWGRQSFKISTWSVCNSRTKRSVSFRLARRAKIKMAECFGYEDLEKESRRRINMSLKLCPILINEMRRDIPRNATAVADKFFFLEKFYSFYFYVLMLKLRETVKRSESRKTREKTHNERSKNILKIYPVGSSKYAKGYSILSTQESFAACGVKIFLKIPLTSPILLAIEIYVAWRNKKRADAAICRLLLISDGAEFLR